MRRQTPELLRRQTLTRLERVFLVAVLGLATVTAACGSAGQEPASPQISDSPQISASPKVSPDTALAQAIAQLQAALGLPEGAVTKSSEPARMPGADVVLQWDEGTAEVDLDTGRIRTIIQTVPRGSESGPLSDAELDAAARLVASLLGWDDATLAAERFTPGESGISSHADAGTEYSKTWVGHDSQGIPTNGFIDVRVDAANKQLRSFVFIPGTDSVLDASGVISEEQAVAIAKGAVGAATSSVTTTAPPGVTTTGTVPIGVVVKSAILKHTNAPGITGGADMLVWIVKLGGSNAEGLVGATVYVDANTGKVLTWHTGS